MKIDKVRKKIKNYNLDAFLFNYQPNVFYLTGFKSSNAFVLLTKDKKYFFTDGRYITSAREKLKDWDVILLKDGIRELKEVLTSIEGKIGFEKDRTTIDFYEKLIKKTDLDKKLMGFSGFLNDIRAIKTEEEIKIIKKAVHKTDEIFKYIVDNIGSFETELDVRREIINQIFKKGGTGESFPAIVASGKNSAIPHYETSNKKIKKNQPLLIDMGMIYKGYCSDFTRTIFIGKVNKKLKEIYEIVKEAHLEATEKVMEGITTKELDETARNVIKKYGYGDYFIHSLGHGIGIEIHEYPRISPKNYEILKEGMVFTIEPGIYIEGLGGVRLENVVVCRKENAEVLTKTPLDMIEINI